MSRTDESLRKNLEKRDQMNARIKALKQKKKAEDRKLRTHRLIRIGGIAESILGREFQEEDMERFLQFLSKQEKNGNYYSRAMNHVIDPSEIDKIESFK